MARRLPQIISKEEFEKIFAVEKNKSMKLALLLGFEAGMRLSEVAGLAKEVSRCCSAELIRTPKGHKKVITCSSCGNVLTGRGDTFRLKDEMEILPLQPEDVDLQAHTIRIVQGKGKKDRIVPLPVRFTEKALTLLPIKLKRRTIQDKFERLTKATLGKKMHYHVLRHGFGSFLAGAGRPLHEIQMLMGHSRLDTTGIYLHANPKQAVEGARDVFS